ncbi:ligand-binding SRPBCC domain-containing protein [Streptosporangium becharense]|uniref:Ligand-binding SRPBCC domain-containing protein n=1 Tax=Streptosporangium becharense TaxID=1816182 RepID=A0A7W9MH72_9ACTN|nr:SRPBCC family protein [Streptosporangium becharense]MBB2908828.1 ligand-binding SRPBCC domain-containing protein [Streptosporangium becharense]MBB5820154.1 ligand-binding SRPBCC domain-containing protein [Streptosporangium becharense]
MPRSETVTHVMAPPERVFDISLDVDVHAASMAGSSEEPVGGVTAGALKMGDTVTWRARHFGIRWRMTSMISAYDRPEYFVDEQVSGPFKYWRHAHYFESDGRGGTTVGDIIELAAPLGPLGRIAEMFSLRRCMSDLIRARNDYIKQVAENRSRG